MPGDLRGRLRIARREFAALRREKTIVLALAIQLFIAGFSSFLLVGLVSLYDPGAAVAGGITVGVAGNASADLGAGIEGEGDWRVVRYEERTAARADFRAGRIDALLLASRGEDGVIAVEALVPDESVRSTVIVVQVREALEAYERARRAALDDRLQRRPLPVPEAPDATPTFAFTYTVLLPLLVFLPAFISGSVAADTITEELDAGTFELLRTTPLSTTAILDGKIGSMVVLAPAQTALWLGLLRLNGTPIANPFWLVAATAAVAGILVAGGAGLAAAFERRRAAQLVYSVGVLAVFSLTAVLPETPPNTVAKLAIGSPTDLSYLLVAGYLVVGGVGITVSRQVGAAALRE